MNHSQLAYSQYHYHHHQAYQHLLQVKTHLQAARSGALLELKEIPEWLLRFEKELKLALEEVPELLKAQKED